MLSATCRQVPTTITTNETPAGTADPCVAGAGIVGGSGYTGALLAELLLRHPSVKLSAISSETFAGQPVQQHLPRVRSDLAFCSQADLDGVDVAFLCTPHGEAAPIAKQLLDGGVKVIDLSADFRLDAATYAAWYQEHPNPELLPGVYGLTELHRDEVAGADLVANPGCYPTAALLALAPLVREGLVETAGIVVDAKSGVTGAGRQSGDAYSFLAVDGDVRAYKVLTHQHTPEIERALSRVVSGARVTFTAHLLPVPRGLLATCYARPRAGATRERVQACLAEAYGRSAFVRAVAPGDVRLSGAVGTNLALVGAAADGDVVVVIGAIDNLLKGAAGQAVQNLNLMNGWDEALGLEHLQRFAA